jgi:hypothetical protein
MEAHATASKRIEQEKVQRAACTARHASQRALQEAQRRKVEGQQRRKDVYLMKTAKEKVKSEADAIRQRVAEELDLERHIRSKRAEFEELAAVKNRAWRPDVGGYEHTLNALRDLAEGVRLHSMQGRGSSQVLAVEDGNAKEQHGSDDGEPEETPPLLDVEPRVLSAFKRSASPSVASTPRPICDLFPDLPEEDDDLPQPNIGEAESCNNILQSSFTPASTFALTPQLGETAAPATPGRRCSSRKSPPPLLVRPLIDLRQQAGGQASPVPNRSARPGSVQSLAAIRRIRRTGPIISR